MASAFMGEDFVMDFGRPIQNLCYFYGKAWTKGTGGLKIRKTADVIFERPLKAK